MNHKGFIIMNLLLIALLFLGETVQAQGPDSPPIDSICMVFAGVDYGGDFSSPQNFPNAKHIANAKVGSHFSQVITWHTGMSWGRNSIFSWWEDMFSIWVYPESLSFTQGEVSRNCCVCADTKGNLHFAWYQSGTPDWIDVFYTRAFLDTANGWIEFAIEKPPVMISATNGEDEHHPTMMTYGDSLIMIVYTVGPYTGEHGIGYNYSIDGGDTWLGPFVAYEHGGPMSWDRFCLPAIAVNPHDGDMWFAIQYDYDYNGCNDVVAFQWQHAPGDTWRHELVAAGQPAPNDHALTCPSMVIDNDEIPHIVFLECLITCGRTIPDRYTGPFGTLYYTHKQSDTSDTWSAPKKIMFPRYEVCNYFSGYPSAGITSDNTVYFSTTQPESAMPDSSYGFLPNNVFYGSVEPYTGEVSYGGMVSNIQHGSPINAIYAHTAYYVPLANEVPPNMHGPDITWSQMVNAEAPSDIYYCHKDTLLGIDEERATREILPYRICKICPNPFSNSTFLTLDIRESTIISAKLECEIYDITGRLINSIPVTSSTVQLGSDLVPGVYIVKLNGKTIGKVVKVR